MFRKNERFALVSDVCCHFVCDPFCDGKLSKAHAHGRRSGERQRADANNTRKERKPKQRLIIRNPKLTDILSRVAKFLADTEAIQAAAQYRKLDSQELQAFLYWSTS